MASVWKHSKIWWFIAFCFLCYFNKATCIQGREAKELPITQGLLVANPCPGIECLYVFCHFFYFWYVYLSVFTDVGIRCQYRITIVIHYCPRQFCCCNNVGYFNLKALTKVRFNQIYILKYIYELMIVFSVMNPLDAHVQ